MNMHSRFHPERGPPVRTTLNRDPIMAANMYALTRNPKFLALLKFLARRDSHVARTELTRISHLKPYSRMAWEQKDFNSKDKNNASE